MGLGDLSGLTEGDIMVNGKTISDMVMQNIGTEKERFFGQFGETTK